MTLDAIRNKVGSVDVSEKFSAIYSYGVRVSDNIIAWVRSYDESLLVLKAIRDLT